MILDKIIGKFSGTVTDVRKLRDRHNLPIFEGGPRFHKGKTEKGVAFNRSYYPAEYRITLEKRSGLQMEFDISTDNPPEIGSRESYRTKVLESGILFY